MTDNVGGVAGIGSRYFSVSSAVPDTASSVQSAPVSPLSVPLAARAITGRRGFSLDSPLRRFPPDGSGVVTIQGEEVDRFELHLKGASTASDQGGTYTGYMRLGSLIQPLPIGSSLDAASGDFSWQPGVGFVGTYDFVFVRSTDGGSAARQDVRIVLNPKASGRVGPQVTIDTPTPYRNIAQPFVLAGGRSTWTTRRAAAWMRSTCGPIRLPEVIRSFSVRHPTEAHAPMSRRCMAATSRIRVTA